MRSTADLDVFAVGRHRVCLQYANAIPPRSKVGELIVPVDICKRSQKGKCIDRTKQFHHDPHQRGMIGILHNAANASRSHGARGNS